MVVKEKPDRKKKKNYPINRDVITWIHHPEIFERKLRLILSNSRTSLSFRTIFRVFYYLTTRKICVSDYSELIEELFLRLLGHEATLKF